MVGDDDIPQPRPGSLPQEGCNFKKQGQNVAGNVYVHVLTVLSGTFQILCGVSVDYHIFFAASLKSHRKDQLY
jgi:hypothetical protein